MRSPIHAMLWEIWRVTRVEAAWKLALGIASGLAALIWCAAIAPPGNPTKTRDFGAVIAMVLIVFPHFTGWLFLARFNKGRPGFPLQLLFTRPVRTTVIVGFSMAYLIAVPSAIYLVSALLLTVISGYPFPLLPVAAWIAALGLVTLAAQWSARSIVVSTFVVMVAGMAWFFFAVQRLTSFPDGFDWQDSPKLWPTIFDFPLTDYAVIASIALASFGIAVAAVARQRRGDVAAGWAPGAGWPEWLVNLFRLPCPTSSAMRAQVWIDLKSRGLPVLTIAVFLAIATPLLFAVCGAIETSFSGGIIELITPALVGLPCMFSAMALVLSAFNAFGLGGPQGSFFEATQPYGTARLAGLKVLVRSACTLAALIAVGVSLCASFKFIPLVSSDKFGSRIEIGDVTLSAWLRAIEGAVTALSGYELLALAVVVAIGVVLWVAALAVFLALWNRYFRRVNITVSLLLLYGLALGVLALAGRYGIVSTSLVDALFSATRWIAAAALVLVTAYLFRSGFAERLLTVRYACGAVVISVAFAVAWLTVLHATGVHLSGMPVANAVSMLSPALLPLTLGVMAPWSLDRTRHM
jgi:hypothetical protein